MGGTNGRFAHWALLSLMAWGSLPACWGCIEPPQVVGCGLRICTGNLVEAEDPDGQMWLFFSGCIPWGWEERPRSISYPDCDVK